MVLQCPRLRIIDDSESRNAASRQRPGAHLLAEPPHVGAAAERHAAEGAGQHRPARHDDRGQVDRGGRHQQRRDGLVAAAEQDDAVDRVGPQHLLGGHRGHVAPEHRGRPDLRLAERHDGQVQRDAAGLPDAALDVLGHLVQVAVARREVGRGVGDRDVRPAGERASRAGHAASRPGGCRRCGRARVPLGATELRHLIFHLSERWSNIWNHRVRYPHGAGKRSAPSSGRIACSRILTELARHPDGISLDELTRAIASPKPTVHRALAVSAPVRLRSPERARPLRAGRRVPANGLRAPRGPPRSPAHRAGARASSPSGTARRPTTRFSTATRSSTGRRSTRRPVPCGSPRPSADETRRTAPVSASCCSPTQLPDDDAVAAWVGTARWSGAPTAPLTTPTLWPPSCARSGTQGYAVDDQENEPGISLRGRTGVPHVADRPERRRQHRRRRRTARRCADLVDEVPAIRADRSRPDR